MDQVVIGRLQEQFGKLISYWVNMGLQPYSIELRCEDAGYVLVSTCRDRDGISGVTVYLDSSGNYVRSKMAVIATPVE